MYGIAFFGLLMAALSGSMISNPDGFARGIVRFSEARYFHAFEILSRLAFGAVFLVYSDQTQFPTTMRVVGLLLVAVGAGLLLTPPARHRQYAVWSADRFRRLFRPAGVLSMAFGVFIVYAALTGP